MSISFLKHYHNFSVTFSVILRSISGTGKFDSVIIFNILGHPSNNVVLYYELEIVSSCYTQLISTVLSSLIVIIIIIIIYSHTCKHIIEIQSFEDSFSVLRIFHTGGMSRVEQMPRLWGYAREPMPEISECVQSVLE